MEDAWWTNWYTAPANANTTVFDPESVSAPERSHTYPNTAGDSPLGEQHMVRAPI